MASRQGCSGYRPRHSSRAVSNYHIQQTDGSRSGIQMMSLRPLAHSQNDTGTTHDLAAHLHEVARRASGFATPFGSSSFAECAGLWHDLGKNSLDFQARVAPADNSATEAHVEDEKVPGRVDHSSAGALHA